MNYERHAVMVAINQLAKVAGAIVALTIGIILLWQTPSWEQQAITKEEVPTPLTTSLSKYEERKFLRHIKTRLPQYREEFYLAGKKYGVPWILLAAQAYQESHWNRNAVSPTGVRGIMMLTLDTASDLGITNRLDPRKSISGGARYLARLYANIPSNVQDPDRMYFALAAYNVGMGHVKDAQRLAVRLKKDQNRWDNLETVLPLLAKKKYYKTLPNRYARGWEPVHYVKRIRAYHEILQYLEQQESSFPEEL